MLVVDPPYGGMLEALRRTLSKISAKTEAQGMVGT